MWLIWFIIFVLLLILELFNGQFVLLCFSLASFITMIISLIGLSFEVQLATFILSLLIIFFKIRPLMLKHFISHGKQVQTNVEALIGKKGIVIEDIIPHQKVGRIKIEGEDWMAISVDQEITEGTLVKILGVDGAKLIVSKVDK